MLHSARRVAGSRSRSYRPYHASHVPQSPKPQCSDAGDAPTRDAQDSMRDEKVKRNDVGVQLLSRKLHSQIFRNTSFPPPSKPYIRIARDHLKTHGLDVTQGSVLPDVAFTLPPLQGDTIDQHFYRIGSAAAQPWLDLAKTFASVQAPPRPEHWHIQPGWTKYHHLSNGSSYSESVPAPQEQLLTFDVETLPAYHHFAVLACAMSPTHWYSWISPWLLGETQDTAHLIPLGDPKQSRLVVGHNVSYDRARVLEEYSIAGTRTRFMDTMALHVAVKGISSHQRPAWTKYRKLKEEAMEMKEEAISAAVELMGELEERAKDKGENQRDLERLRQEIEDSLPQLESDHDPDEVAAEWSSKRWEEITSANSLADVAKLHCNIEVDKTVRKDFMTHTPEQIVANVTEYLDYCAEDVRITHAVYSQVLPAFLKACPNPVSFAGILTMGSSLLTVNQEWNKYLAYAESTYKELDDKIRKQLVALAIEAKELMIGNKWKNDVWLSQLDWTPKVAGKSRGLNTSSKVVGKVIEISNEGDAFSIIPSSSSKKPKPQFWYDKMKSLGPLHRDVKHHILPWLLRLSHNGRPLHFDEENGWFLPDENNELKPLRTAGLRVRTILGRHWGLKALRSGLVKTERECDQALAFAVCAGHQSEELVQALLRIADEVKEQYSTRFSDDPWLSQLIWSEPSNSTHASLLPWIWPKWYWELTRPKKGEPPGTVDITVRNRISPLLLQLSWLGWPLFHSREHGWIFRVSPDAKFETRQRQVHFFDEADKALEMDTSERGYRFYKLPHKDGEDANVGSPLGKTFMKYAQDGTLTGPGNGASDALDMNAQCSYWISSRDRIMKQMVVWQNQNQSMGFQPQSSLSGHTSDQSWGIILPQVITMGTVTRRAIEKTWLTASNAKKNRVGSELKAMVRAPPGYAIVGADVDSEELWISSAMGDAQFGLHGATALGWMTLEGTKSAGTDLHSKTASILGISRDQAKVFNYSRIYGAGLRHAVLLLLQGNPSLLIEDAEKLAEKLYVSTKGRNTYRTDIFGRKFWFGGTESYVFNKLEEIALSDAPRTPALGCGITNALSKEHLPAGFGTDYMTSRINWVVQSSGVDYLHLLIVSMEHLIAKYDINARYLMSVHDELRYLVTEEDRYRAALALQVANLWTRSLFAFRLGMDDLPQGVAFFSAVDVDHVLRKEVDLPCVTPSQPTPIPPGEALDILRILEKTNGGTLWRDGGLMGENDSVEYSGSLEGYEAPNCLSHRASSAHFLQAQATSEFAEIRRMAELASGEKFTGGVGSWSSRKGPPKKSPKKLAKFTRANADEYDT